MGKWDHRPRRFFRRQRSPPPKFYDITAPLPESWKDGVPLWEKKYCKFIGVPWQKIVDTKKFTFCHNNVFDWNDSAAEEGFEIAKKRYWANINSLPCDISLPDPDSYIHQIDWNPYIDPELIKEADSAYFALPDEEQSNDVKNKRTKSYGEDENPWECTDTPHSGVLENKVQGEIDIKNKRTKISEDDENPWEGAGTPCSRVLENKDRGGNQWDYHVGDSANVDNTNNPWESSIAHGNEGLTDNGWHGGRIKSWGSNEGRDNKNQYRDWSTGYSLRGNDCLGIPSQIDKGWGKVRDGSWCQKQQQQSRNLAYVGEPWECKSSQHTRWRNRRANVSGTEEQLENACVSGDLQSRRNYEGRTAWNQRFQRRGGFNRHDFGYNGSQFQRVDRVDRQTDHYWRRDR
ncbi:hypothetical protein Lal_00042060 [Lupinus albus]|uniref:Uncharacterized protein n=1 Tax=Lupinus albus TaxID=3870 RepID=A0A6A5PMR7_LUPAL|nr:hypothetical protein Lalb_Chr01g0013831 [Lupinus albus]KAF1898369.1 hypothetical protein Lal_00042060 [Lupinus albus]